MEVYELSRGCFMGTTVCAYHVRDYSQRAGLKALEVSNSPRAFVSPLTDHWLSVVDENSEAFDLQALENTVAKVSKHLGADVLLVAVYDDDVSLYVAFRGGVEVDRYSSNKDAFHWLRSKRGFPGNPRKLSEAFSWWQGQKGLEVVLKKKFSLEASRLKNIAKAFGILEGRVFTTFGDITRPLSPFLLQNITPGSFLDAKIRDRETYLEFKGGTV